MKFLCLPVLLFAAVATCAAGEQCKDNGSPTPTPTPTLTPTATATPTLPPAVYGVGSVAFTSSSSGNTATLFVAESTCFRINSCITKKMIGDGNVDWSAFGETKYIFTFPNLWCDATKRDYKTLSASVAQRTNMTTADVQSFVVYWSSHPSNEYSRYLDACPQQTEK